MSTSTKSTESTRNRDSYSSSREPCDPGKSLRYSTATSAGLSIYKTASSEPASSRYSTALSNVTTNGGSNRNSAVVTYRELHAHHGKSADEWTGSDSEATLTSFRGDTSVETSGAVMRDGHGTQSVTSDNFATGARPCHSADARFSHYFDALLDAKQSSQSTNTGAKPICCSCGANALRCRTDQCECFARNRDCKSGCQSEHLKNDCLNKQIIRCTCPQPVLMAQTKSAGKRNRSGSSDTLLNLDVRCGNDLCECSHYGEKCGPKCACYGECKQPTSLYESKRAAKKSTTPRFRSVSTNKSKLAPQNGEKFAEDWQTFNRLSRPTSGCACSAKKKTPCSKGEKCPCRRSLQHCGLLCKCQSECLNHSGQQCAKTTVHAFSNPSCENTTCATALVAVLSGTNGYEYRMEINQEMVTGKAGNKKSGSQCAPHAEQLFIAMLTSALMEYNFEQLSAIEVYLPQAPCFHQDCEPLCDDTCTSRQCCAKKLALALGQWRRLLRNANLKMAVKFLTPYMKRGHLYMDKGISEMLQCGIRVEPLILKDWHKILQQGNKAALSDSIRLWTEKELDVHVRASQKRINFVRGQLRLQPILWSSDVHEVLKQATCMGALTERRVQILLKQMHFVAKEVLKSSDYCSLVQGRSQDF